MLNYSSLMDSSESKARQNQTFDFSCNNLNSIDVFHKNVQNTVLKRNEIDQANYEIYKIKSDEKKNNNNQKEILFNEPFNCVQDYSYIPNNIYNYQISNLPKNCMKQRINHSEINFPHSNFINQISKATSCSNIIKEIQ